MDDSVLIITIVVAGAVITAWATIDRPLIAAAVLFGLAAMSIMTVETPIGTMRVEQPAIVAGALMLVATGRWRALAGIGRWTWAIAFSFAAFLAILTLSSVIQAPRPVDSLRLVAWLAVSMTGGVVVFALLRERHAAAAFPFAAGGTLTALAGIAAAVLFAVAGPSVDNGIQGSDEIFPRVRGLAWETNLFASLLAMCIPLGLDLAEWWRGRLAAAPLVLMAVALPLGGTRGAYLGLAAGLVVYVGLRLIVAPRAGRGRFAAAITAAALIAGFVLSGPLLPNLVDRNRGDVAVAPIETPPTGEPSQAVASGEVATESPLPTTVPIVTASPMPLPSLRAYPDTISFRLDRVPVALTDLRGSPIIGLGMESFGQRHQDPSQGGAPDHIAILAVAALYESGVVGTVALAMGFLLLVVGLVRRALNDGRAARPRDAGVSIAFAATIVAMLVAYQATNALHFAINWMLIGGAAAVLTTWPLPAGTRGHPSD